MMRKQVILSVPNIVRRNIGVFAPTLQKASDPIQQLFINKIREYKEKSSSGKLEMSPELQKLKSQELEKISKQFGSAPGVDMTQFPTFNFQEPQVDMSSVDSK